jgi:signal transduction histidine kinase
VNERALSRFLVLPTLLVVLVLSVLLYRWSNQVSEATTVRLADSLQMSMVNWHLNFFRDFADLAMAMRVDPEGPSNVDPFVRRLAEWKATAPYPAVVANLLILGSDGTALRVDPESGLSEPREWPANLARLRGELERSREQTSSAGDLYSPGGIAGWRFEPTTPVLVRPIASGAGEWLVLELDLETIRSRVLPDLARRYFSGVDGLDYLVAVVSGPRPGHVVYSSDPGFGDSEVVDADGLMDVFGLLTTEQLGSPIHVFHKLSESAGLTGLAAALGTSWFPLLQSSNQESGWQLIVRHRRGGALGAFVAEMQRRDLAISFGVLFLLVLSVAMLIVGSHRANRLARLQMDFVTAVSHELRSPLTIIRSAAENIVHGVVGNPEQMSRYGSVIEGQTKRLSRLVEEVLLFAATREDRHRYDITSLEVATIIDTAVGETQDLIDASGFTLERVVPTALVPVRGDLAALSQCLQNLITNALKYGGEAAWVGIRAGVSRSDPTGDREVQIVVADRGIGIDAVDLPHVFEPFYRSSRATESPVHGTGLGLSLARNIAEAMRGRLTVVSDPRGETSFTLHLPCEPARADDADTVRPTRAAAGVRDSR